MPCTLYLQEFEGADGGEDNAAIQNPDSIKAVSDLLQMGGSEDISFALTTLRTTTRGRHCLFTNCFVVV